MATKKKRRRRNMSALQRQYFGKRRKSNAPRKRRRSSAARTNAPRRRRRRRNPAGFSVTGILMRVKRGAVDAGCVVGGQAVVRYASSQFSYADGSMMDTMVEVGAALLLGIVAEQVVGTDHARFLLAGGLSSPLGTLVKQANIPILSPLLGDAPNANTAAVYPPADGSRIGAWSPSARLGAWAPGQALTGRQARAQLPASAAVLQS